MESLSLFNHTGSSVNSSWILSPLAVQQSNSSDGANVIQAGYNLKIAYFIIGAFGLFSNLFVIIVVLTYPPMRKHVTNIYIINQSSIDTTVACFLILTTLFENDMSRSMTPGYVPDEALCRLWYTKMPLWSMMVSSTYGIVALTLERFLAVVYPLLHKRTCSGRKMAVTLLLTWVIGPLYNIAYMTPSAKILSTGNCTVYSEWPSAVVQSVVGVLTIVVQFLFPLVALVYGYTRMALVLHRLVADSNASANTGNFDNRRNEIITRARMNVVKTLATVSFFFVFCWAWNQTYYLMYYLGSPLVSFTCDFYNFTVIMVFLNCCVNPVIYCVRYQQFQRGVMWMVCRDRVRRMLAGPTVDTVSSDERQLVCRSVVLNRDHRIQPLFEVSQT